MICELVFDCVIAMYDSPKLSMVVIIEILGWRKFTGTELVSSGCIHFYLLISVSPNHVSSIARNLVFVLTISKNLIANC